MATTLAQKREKKKKKRKFLGGKKTKREKSRKLGKVCETLEKKIEENSYS